jgi:hypothetical protein
MSSNWEQKLFHYKADPPPSAWDAIAAGLDAQKESFPEKLYNYAEQPPAGAWQNIEAQLPEAESAKVVHMRTKWLRYAAAAVLLLAIAGMAYFSTLTNNQSATAGNTANTPLLNTTPAAPPAKKEITTHYNLPPQPAEVATTETATKEKSNRATYTMAAASMVNRVPRKQQHASLPIEPAFAGGLDVVPQQKNIIDTDRADRYMIATPEDGDPVRLPKKVYSAFACPEDDPRHQACELRLTQLQQKMSASLTTDFAHFLDLLMNLQEN